MLSTIIKYLYLIALIAPMSILAMPITIIAPNETFTLDVEPSDSIDTVKGLVEQQTSIAQARQTITFNGQTLENGRSLSDYNVQKNSTLNVTKSNAAPSFSANSPWQQVGSIPSSVGDSTNLNITVDNNNIPYIIFKNGQSQAVVYKFSDTNTWELVGGSALSTDSASNTDIAFDTNNRLYAAFISGTSVSKKVVVKELVNGSWNELGSDQITGSNLNHIDLKTDKNGVLYLAYGNSYSYVKKWDGTNWVSVGSQASGGRSESPEIAFNSMNELHIVSRITERIPAFVEVRKFDGANWHSLSSTGLSGLSGGYPQIAFDSQDTAYVSLINSTSYQGPVKVVKLVNDSWSEVGDTSTFSAIRILNLLIDSNDKPLIAFSEQATNGRGQLYIYENNTWSSLGQVAPADKAFYFGIRMRAALDSANTFYAIDTTTEIGSPFVVKKTYSAFENYSKNISEGTTGETLFNNVSIADADNDEVTLTVTLSDTQFGSLSGTASGSASISYDEATGILTLSGNLTDVNASIASIVFNGSTNGAGNFTISFSVTDGTASSSIIVGNYSVKEINDPPSVSINTGLSINEGDSKVITNSMLSAKDSDDSGTGLTYTLKSVPTNGSLFVDANDNGSLDSGEKLAVNGTFTQQTLDDSKLYYKHDGSETTSDSFNFDLADGGEDSVEPITNQVFSTTVIPVNDLPVIESEPVTAVQVDQLYKYQIIVTDAENDEISITASFGDSFLSWVAYDNSTRTITGLPEQADIGIYPITIHVLENGVEKLKQEYSLNVTRKNEAPVITSSAQVWATEDTEYLYSVKASDADIGDTLTFSAIGLPSWLTIDSKTGVLSGTPTNDDVGTHYVAVVVTDSLNASDRQDFVINVANVNDKPTITSTPVTTAKEGELYSYKFTAVDVDPGDSLTYSGLNLPSWLTFNSVSQVLSGTPTNENVGKHAITLLAVDSKNEASTQKYTLTVLNVNDAPVSQNDTASVDEDNIVAINVLENDTDVDSQLNPASVMVVTPPEHGKTSLNTATGVITYTPNKDYNGKDSFTYTVEDMEASRSNTSIVSITINAVNDAPIALGDEITTDEDMAVEIDVVANDKDIDSNDAIDLSTLEVVTLPENGDAKVSNELIIYTPKANFSGSDSFTYRIADKAGAFSKSATVLITIGEINDAPVASADTFELNEDIPTILSILDNDVDVDSELLVKNVTVTKDPSHGVLNIDSESGQITYTPQSNYFGSDGFSYAVKDEQSLMSNIAPVNLTIKSINDAPIANNDTAVILEDTLHNINVLGNDSDVDGSLDESSIEIVNAPLQGIAIASQGVISYTPNANSNGEDTFTYRVKDDLGEWSNAARVSLTVTPVNDAPLANNDTVQINEDESIVINVIINDDDVDGSIDVSSLQIVNSPSFGQVVNNADGTFAYTHTSNYVGIDSFSYTLFDNEGAKSNIASVTITILSVNDAPVIESAALTSATQDEFYSYTLVINDVDSADSYKLSAPELPGWLNFNLATGELSGTPTNDDVGTHAVTLLVTDAEGLTDTQTFVITVADVNDEATGGISISGEAKQGQTLRVESTIEDPDGVGEFTYQWMRNGVLISGATLSEYMLTDADIGATITVVVTYVDGNGNTETFTSGATSPVIIANTAPVANGEQLSTNEDESITFTLSYFDENGDDLTFNLVTPVSNGTLTMDANSFTYQPNADFYGTDSFSYQVSDGKVSSELATVTIIVNPVSDAPISVPDSFTINTDLNEFMILDVLANDRDADGDELTILNATASAGVVRIVDNKLEYLAPVGMTGEVVITYQIRDSSGEITEVTLVVSLVSTSQNITIIAPDDRTIASEGLFTKVNMGTAIALDSLGNPVRVTASSKGFFASGTHTVVWTAGEGSDQVSATQLIHVVPQVNFSKDQTATEGTTVTIKAILNGDAVSYPVIVPYSVSGDATQGLDHDLVDGEFVFNKGQREAQLIVNLAQDEFEEGSETVVVSLSDPQSAVIGPLGTHTLTIAEGNVAPSVQLFASQNGLTTRIIDKHAGEVTISALVIDANLADTHSYDWSVSSDSIVDIDQIDDQFSFDPSNVENGTYQFTIVASDGDKTGSMKLELTILESAPLLTSEDTDFDGISDLQEGYGDSDNDGIPDYIDSVSLAKNVLQEKFNESEFFLMETEPGLQLSLGHVAFVAHGTQTGITGEEVEQYANNSQNNVVDASFNYENGVFDFNVTDIPVPGQSVSIVMAQFSPVPSNAVYRKLMPTGWTEFVVDSKNSIASAPGVEGFCPPPRDEQYEEGLKEGYWCVQLTIEDGGPNDADGLVNRAIEDPSGLATLAGTNTKPDAQNDTVVVKRNTATYLDVLSNDSDADGDSLTLTSASVDIGQVSIANNQLYFTPQAEHLGTASISYAISDGQGGSSYAKVNVDVVENEAPSISLIVDVSTEDQNPVTVDVLANVSDEDNNSFIIIFASANNGTVIINADNTLTYTPNVGFEGIDTVTFTVSDGDGGTVEGQFNVLVNSKKRVTVESKTRGGSLPLGLIVYLFFYTLYRRYSQKVRR
ncbi:tandem-95 repeat protein [Pseudoalteromonas sp. SSMSWG5]|uniref:tandem-95 repeat protein n=1 Tax=Pseudoalteromonas sp. SSMSWG5 TaxID=3139396 RepID=UPI003BAAE72B